MPEIDDGYQGCSGYMEIVAVSASLREAKGKPCVEVHVHDAAGSSTALYYDGAELRRMADDLKLAANELDRAQGKVLRIVEGRIAHIPEGWSVVDFLDGDGHAQVTTTQRYDRRPKRVLAAAAERLRVPYEGKEA